MNRGACVASFDVGTLGSYELSNDGTTATKKSRGETGFVGVSPSFDSGASNRHFMKAIPVQRYRRSPWSENGPRTRALVHFRACIAQHLRVVNGGTSQASGERVSPLLPRDNSNDFLQNPPRRCPLVGVHECTFRVNKMANLYLGIVPEDKIDVPDKRLTWFGYALYSWGGELFYPSIAGFSFKEIGAAGFRSGDTLTVRADLDENKISFRKNGADNGAPYDISSGSYFFAFFSDIKDDAVTIVERK